MRWPRKRKWRKYDQEIAPDEIFLDASNSPEFNTKRFEGRLEKPLPRSTFIMVAVGLGIIFFALAARAADLELVNGKEYAIESAHNSLSSSIVFAQRGLITGEHGTVLADNVTQSNGAVQREYMYPSLSQVIGYVSYPKKDANGYYYAKTEKGITGLEARYNSLLTGDNGKMLTETDAFGHVRSSGTIIPAQSGGTLKLTIDANLQKLFAQALAKVAQAHGFIAGAGAIIDVHNGAVRALVSYPSYDANVMASGGPAATINSYNHDPGHPFLDHAIQGVYTPGSIVKPFEALGALTDGIITPSTIIVDNGRISVPDPYHPGKSFVYTGWKALGPLDVQHAIAWSSDIFFYTVAGGFGNQKGLGIKRLDYWYKEFGLGAPTGINLPGEASGLVPSPAWKEKTLHQPWYLGDTYFTGIGQYSMQVTPIQMARATAAIANGGKLYTPTLLANQKPSYTVVPGAPWAFKVVRGGMRLGVTTALAHAVNLPYVSVAAKTGTAQVGAQNQYDNAWVEGFFPYDNPQYAFSVVLERGPSGQGEEAVNVMHDLFVALHDENSPYTGGTGAGTSSAKMATARATSTAP